MSGKFWGICPKCGTRYTAPNTCPWCEAELLSRIEDGPMSATETMEIIPIGEPGCIATPGHVDLPAFTETVKLAFGAAPLDYWDEDYEPARHTWMVVTTQYDADWDEDVTLYRETFHSHPNAEPYTLMACIGYWSGPQP